MSIFNHYTLSPGAVASMTEPTPDLQRNYRQRGMLEGYGELQENGRWKYSLTDLVGIWICDRLSQRGQGMERREGFRLGMMLAGRVINMFTMSRYGGNFGSPPFISRYAVLLHMGAGDTGEVFGSSVKSLNRLEDLTEEKFDYAQVIDVENLAKGLPENIRGLLIAADENEKDDLVPHMDEQDD